MTDTPSFKVSAGEHLCAVYEGDLQRDQILSTYLRDGVAAGDKCLFGAHDSNIEALLDRLGHFDGFSADIPGQVELRTAREPIFVPEEFTLAGTLAFWSSAIQRALGEGYRFVRLGTEAQWWAPQVPDSGSYLDYEIALNGFAPNGPQVILCMYDVRRADGAFIMNAIRVHSRLILYGQMLENPYYVRPDDLPHGV